MAVGKGRPRQLSKGSCGWHGCGGGRGSRRPFCLGLRPLATWPGCHFVARPPFRAAEGGRAAGEGRALLARGGAGGSAGAAPAEAQASASPLFFASGFAAWGSGSAPGARAVV